MSEHPSDAIRHPNALRRAAACGLALVAAGGFAGVLLTSSGAAAASPMNQAAGSITVGGDCSGVTINDDGNLPPGTSRGELYVDGKDYQPLVGGSRFSFDYDAVMDGKSHVYSASITITEGNGQQDGPYTDQATIGPCGTAVQQPTVNLSENKSEITVGQSAQLSWTSQSATSLTASGAWSGSKAVPSGNQTVTPSAPGTYTYTLKTNTNSAGQGSDSVTLKVDAVVVTPPSSPAPPTCVTLTTANVGQYGTLVWTGSSATVTLKGAKDDYCNNWSFDTTRYAPAAFPQTVKQVDTQSVGKSGLTATATVNPTTCGQNDGYEGSGPAVGSTLTAAGQGYEKDHKFLSQIFGGPNSYTVVSTGCNVAPPTSTAPVSPSTSVPAHPGTSQPASPISTLPVQSPTSGYRVQSFWNKPGVYIVIALTALMALGLLCRDEIRSRMRGARG